MLKINILPNRTSIKGIQGQSGNNKKVLAEKITPQSGPTEILISALHKHHLQKIFYMVDTNSNMQIYHLKSKTLGGKSLINLIDITISTHLYPLPGSDHDTLL